MPTSRELRIDSSIDALNQSLVDCYVENEFPTESGLLHRMSCKNPDLPLETCVWIASAWTRLSISPGHEL